MDSEFVTLAKKLRRRKGVLHEKELLELNWLAGREYLIQLPGWSVEEYFEYTPEDRICEYQDGVVIIVSAASNTHQQLVLFVTRLLADFVEEQELGQVYNGPYTTRLVDAYFEPDIFFFGTDKQIFAKELVLDCEPDLAIEVLSPSTRRRDQREKLAKYQEARTPEYWIVDPQEQRLTVWRLADAGYMSETLNAGVLESSAVPGFRIDVGWLWQSPRPRISSLPDLSNRPDRRSD
jgi:Uma2 family endonuclease